MDHKRNIVLPPLAKVMGVGRQQLQHVVVDTLLQTANSFHTSARIVHRSRTVRIVLMLVQLNICDVFLLCRGWSDRLHIPSISINLINVVVCLPRPMEGME